MSNVKIELLTQPNCPKCDWFKDNVLPHLIAKEYDISIINAKDYDKEFFELRGITHTPAVHIETAKTSYWLDKGLTLKNIERLIQEFASY